MSNEVCKTCHGSGEVWIRPMFFRGNQGCPVCGGECEGHSDKSGPCPACSKPPEQPECPYCDGTGKEPIVYCGECKKPCDPDGYCDPCADKAAAKWSEEHGGRSPGEGHGLRMTERAVASEKATLASVRLAKALSVDSHALFLSQESLAAHEELFESLRALGRIP